VVADPVGKFSTTTRKATTMDILAGSTTDLRWDKTAKAFQPAAAVSDGPVFTIRCLDFWQAQEIIDSATPAVDRIRRAFEMGLVSIDGDEAKAKAFLAKPRAMLGNPLFDAILEMAAGN